MKAIHGMLRSRPMAHGAAVLLLLASCFSHAISRVDIRVGEMVHPAGRVTGFSATLGMDGHWQGRVAAFEGSLPRLAQWGPSSFVVSRGTVQGTAEFSGDGFAPQHVRLNLTAHDVAFADADGSHAGEGVGGTVALEAKRQGSAWQGFGTLDWTAGEAFWQPWYLAQGGVRFTGQGTLSQDALEIAEGRMSLPGASALALSGRWVRPGWRLDQLDATTRALDLAAVYPVYLKPVLAKTMLGDLEMAGSADARVRLRSGQLDQFEVTLRDMDVEDKRGRFALYKVAATIPWDSARPTQALLRYDGGRALQLPLGAADLKATLYGYSLTSPGLVLPVLDGALHLREVSAAFLNQRWHWHLGAELTPVSMPAFTHAVGWPSMEGSIAATVPLATYTEGHMTLGGATRFRVFDGAVAVERLELHDPLGLAPRLQADIALRGLDLGLLTRTFSFGTMAGRLDGDVRGLVLSRWQPVEFDASFRSAAGDAPRKISQRAVENISALGGAGAAAAIQRSFLRFFKEFNYAAIGLSCRLKNGVCAMGGLEPAQSGYVIVKGSGIPAITVLGYNRNVSWSELLSRVKHIAQGNAKPVIK